jgi:CRP/FNR family transcriptional regulator, cyclic AMP receptor protein
MLLQVVAGRALRLSSCAVARSGPCCCPIQLLASGGVMQSLSKVPFFKTAADVDFERFDRRCTWKKFDDGATVVDFDDASTDVYFILAGEVRIIVRTQAGKEIIFAEMKSGQYFGELAAIDGAKRSANVTALTRCELAIVPASVFKEIIFHSPLICDKLLNLLVGRVRELNARLTEHAVFDLKHRLYAELLRLAQPRPGGQPGKAITPPPFHHLLAARIGCRREQVTRELSALTEQGMIEKTRGALILKRPETLQSRLDQALQSDR